MKIKFLAIQVFPSLLELRRIALSISFQVSPKTWKSKTKVVFCKLSKLLYVNFSFVLSDD